MNILLRGGSSFIGKNLIEKFPSDWNIKATYCNSNNFLEFSTSFRNVEPIKLDLIKGKIPKLGKADMIFYLPTMTPGQVSGNQRSNMHTMYCLHASGIEDVLDQVESCDTIYYFSSGIYYLRNDYSDYRKSKLIGEANSQSLSMEKGINYLILRNMEVYGPYLAKHKLYRRICEAYDYDIERFEVFGDGENLIDTMYIDDYTDLLMNLINNNVKNKILPFARSKPVTVKELIKQVSKVYKKNDVKIKFKGKSTESTRFTLNNHELLKYVDIIPDIDLFDGLSKWKNNGLI